MSTVVPFDGELDAPAPAAAPTTTPTVAAKVVPFDGELDAPAAPSQAGAGRGMVNPPLATEPQPERVNTRDVGLGEGMYRDMRLGQSGMSKTVGLALASIPAMAEEVWSSTLEDYFGHDKQTGVTDAAMGSLVQPSDQQLQANEFKPGEQRSVGNRVAGALTRMITVDLPAMLASGGETAPATLARGAQPVVQVLRESLEHGLKASQPVMINAATEKADQVLKAGGDEKQAVISGLTAAMSTAVQNSVALSVPGKVFSRVAGGGIVGSAMGEGSRVIQNIADPEKLHREFDPGEAAVSAATGAVLSGVMGERSSPRPLDRIDLGYDPLTAKKPVDEAVQGMGEGASMYRGPEPGVAQPAREGVDAIFKAGSVEEAAAAASRVVREGVDAGVDTELNKLRPLRPSTEGAPDVSAADAVPGVPAGADRLGGDDAAAGVVPPAGDRGADGRAVDAAGDRDGAAPVAAPVGAERALELKTRPYNEGERAQAESAIASLNAGLERSNADRIASKVGAPDEPAQVLQSAPTGDMVRARQVARLFGLPVTFIEPHARFNGVHIEGQIFISPQEKHPVLAVMGHEVLHGVMSKLGGEQAQALRDRIAPFLRPEAVQARLQAEPHRGREHATEEAIADLNGSMWMDPKFWQAVREQDPHAFRQLAYRFMELAATVHQKLGKVSRFQAEKFTTDVDTVRRILAEQHAMLAKEEGVERLSPNEKAEFGVRKEKPAEPAKFDRTEGEEPAVERRRVARNAPEPREMPADHEVEMAPRVDAALRRWAKGQGDDRDLAAAIQRDGQRVPGARMLENTQGTVADETPSFDRDKDTTPFYSALARGVEAIPSKAQGADGWRAQVKGLVNKGLVKQDEIEWTGLDDWLKLQPGKVSKEQVLEYLKANGVKVEEVQKGGEEGTSRFDQVVVDASALGYTFDGQGVDTTLVDRSGKVWQYDNLLDAFIPHGPEAESDNPPKLTGRIAELADEYVKISDDDPYADRPEAQTRYSQYTLPGGENYREVLLTLPTDSRGADESMIDRLNQRLVAKGMDGLAEDQRAALQRGGNDAMNMLDDLNQRVGIRTEDVARAMANGDPDKQYRSSHWDEPNILAHIRLNDRNSTDPLTEQQQADIGKRAQMQKRADELAHKIGKASRDGRIAGDIRREELLKELRPLVRAGKMTPAEMMRRLDDAAFSTATDDVMAMQRERDALLSSMPPEPKQKSSRVLFVEEIQSDWAQQGRKQGFRRDAEGLTPEEESRFQKLLETGRSNLTGDARSEFNALLQRRDGAAESKAAVPRAPFVEKTDAWVNLALKRVIKMAVDEGYDKVAFVTGEQSADRYGLEKQISRVEFQDNHTLGVGKADLAGPASRGILHAYDLNGRRVIDRPIDNAAKELPELIGEEVTQKLLSATPVSERTAGGNESRIRRLQGVDLKVGGEGMKSFYDKIIPSALGKLLPKLGGGNLAEVRIGKTEAKAEIDRKSMREDLRELAKHDIGYDEFRERHGLDASMVSDEELEAIDDRDPHNRSRVGPVITGLIDTIAGRVAAGKAMKQTGFDVTPAMKEKAGPGLPLFSRKAEEGKVDKLQMVAERGERQVGKRAAMSTQEKEDVRASAEKTGVSEREISSVVREHKLAHPPQQGWAPLVFLGAKVNDKGKLEYRYQAVPYDFNAGKDGKSLEPGSPEYKRATQAVARGMVDEVRRVFQRAQEGEKNAQNILAQAGWYKAMRSRLRHEFGGLGDLFADLLGATSPNTPVRDNWSNAVDSLRRATRGDFDELMPQWQAWVGNIDTLEASLRGFFNEKLEQGLTKKAIKALPEYQQQLEQLRAARKLPDDLLPTKETDKKYGFNGKNVVRAMVDLWRVVKNADPDVGRGGTAPKALNFSGNLIGFRSRATIDVWAARMLQRLAGGLRIPSMAETGVSGDMREDGSTTLQFGFGQDVFSEAVRRIRQDPELRADQTLANINDDDLQAVVWFVEKELWTVNDWTSTAGEGGSFELEASLTGTKEQQRVRELRQILDGGPRKGDTPATVAKRAQAKAAARVELASLERTVDRYTGGLSTQMSAGTQGVDYVPTNADMARLGDRVRQAIYEADDGVTVLASKALSTEGRYGDPERSLDLEVVAREGYDPTTLWRQMLHEAQAAKQDSTFLSRVLREGEAVDPLVHRPGVEIYLREGASGEQLQSMLDELAKHGAQYLTVVVDGRRSGQSMGGEMPPAVGVRIQYVPEFEQRYGMENLLPMQDVSLAAKMQAKAADLAELADLVSGKVEGVSHAHQYWYETQVAFGHQYRELLNGIATGSSEGIAGAAAGGGNWRGQSVREGLASADRQSGKAALEQPARADDAVGRDATRTAPVAEPSFSREENEQRRGAGLPTREVQVNGKWRPIEDSTGRIIGQGDFLKQQAFYKWFSDSKVADDQGRPLVMYHGTFNDFSTFRQSSDGSIGPGVYLTKTPSEASIYAGMEASDTGGHVMPVYVRLRNPAPESLAEELEMKHGSGVQRELQKLGYDGIMGHDTVVVFDPAAIKSAIGNDGTYSPTNPDIRFARATAVPAGLPAAAPSSRWERSKAVVSDLIDEGLSRSGVYRLTAPMSEGTARAKAVAQNFANAERRARDEWNSVASYIEKNFDQAQRAKMWNAADEENDILAGREQRTTTNGLAALDAKQRTLVNRLHVYGEELLQRARDVGMFNGEGVPYWTPRMMVMLDPAGDFQRPQDTTPGKKATSGGEGRNVFTSSSNLKQRKYLSSSETQAAMQAKGGELVRDIYTMPMAMARLERAIAGRELINQIKELGKATGQTLVSTGRPDHEGFFTLDHGSFTTWQPRFEKDAAGKMKVVMSENGEPVFDRVPLYMSKEFEGPVRSILTQQDGPLYRAFMLLKSKAMSAIMFSPLIHNMVIFGRALGYDPTFAGTVALYVKGHTAKQDRDMVRAAIDHGMVPMGQNKNGMMDVTDVARGFGREGGPLDPNESLVAHGAGALTGLINKKLGAKVKGGIDAAGDFWHGTLLWNRIGDLQMGIYQHAHDRLVGQGFSEDVAGTMAAHWANRYAGAVGRENMSAIARKTANVMLFSRSFNMGNLGTIKDMFYGMPEGLRGKILHEATPEQAKQAFTEARRKAVGAFVADTALALIGLAVAQSAVDNLKKDKSWEEIFGGYTERAGRMWEEVKRHPATPTSYNPLRLSPTFDNEPGKQERVDYGEIPGQGARHQYMRLPTGKVVEDLFNWMLHPAETFSSKMSPLAKAVWQVIQNDKGFDVPVVDPDSSAGKAVLQAAAHLAKAQVPWDTIVTMWDKLHGKTTPIENDKLVGQMTGFTWSQGHPGGPEAGVYAQTEERVKQQRLYAMEEVKRLLRYDQEDKARERLEEIGLTPKEVTSILKRLEKPKEGMGREQRRKFNQHSGEDEQRRMESVTR